jgi:hypothetical protein
MNPRQKAAERTAAQVNAPTTPTPDSTQYRPPLKPAPNDISGAEYAVPDYPGYPGSGTQGKPGVIPLQAGRNALDLSQNADAATLSNMSQEDYDKYSRIHGGVAGGGDPKYWEHFGKGVGNAAGLGIPEALSVHGVNKIPILNLIPGLQKSQKDVNEAQYQWDLLHYNNSFKQGEPIGDIASTFIPFAGAVEKGATAFRGGKAAKEALDIARASAEAAKQSRLQKLLTPVKEALKAESATGQTLGGAIKNNTINAAAAQTVRDITSTGSPNLGNTATAGAWGAGGGFLGHKIGELLNPLMSVAKKEGQLANKFNPNFPPKVQKMADDKLKSYGNLEPIKAFGIIGRPMPLKLLMTIKYSPMTLNH